MTVYIPHPIAALMAGVHQYGRIESINYRYVYPDDIKDQSMPYGFMQHIYRAVKDFDPQQDYLLLAGDVLQVAVLVAELLDVHGAIRVLRYDRVGDGYFPVWIGDRKDDAGTEGNH